MNENHKKAVKLRKSNTNKNISSAIQWIKSQLDKDTRKLIIDNSIIINDLNYSL